MNFAHRSASNAIRPSHTASGCFYTVKIVERGKATDFDYAQTAALEYAFAKETRDIFSPYRIPGSHAFNELISPLFIEDIGSGADIETAGSLLRTAVELLSNKLGEERGAALKRSNLAIRHLLVRTDMATFSPAASGSSLRFFSTGNLEKDVQFGFEQVTARHVLFLDEVLVSPLKVAGHAFETFRAQGMPVSRETPSEKLDISIKVYDLESLRL